LFGSARITIVATPRIDVVNPINMPIGTSGNTVPLPVIVGVNFPQLPCRCVSLAACSCMCIAARYRLHPHTLHQRNSVQHDIGILHCG
jgi:hypothetical protein